MSEESKECYIAVDIIWDAGFKVHNQVWVTKECVWIVCRSDMKNNNLKAKLKSLLLSNPRKYNCIEPIRITKPKTDPYTHLTRFRISFGDTALNGKVGCKI